MSIKHLFAIAFVFGCTAIAWFALGASVTHRTGESSHSTLQAVTQLWGGSHVQKAPSFSFREPVTVTEEVVETDEEGHTVRRNIEKVVHRTVRIPIERTRVEATLDLDHRRKGLLWYDTYGVDFGGKYRITLPDGTTGPVRIGFDFPETESIYDDFLMRVNGELVRTEPDLQQGVVTMVDLEPGEPAEIEIGYRSRGLDTWSYLFAADGVSTVRDFELVLSTDFTDYDFPPSSLSPSTVEADAEGARLTWRFDNLVSGKHVGVDLPNRLNPGPLAARITFFAPVSLLFFVTVLVMLSALGHLSLHPMHYFFLAAAFFAFHLLLAYLVDHVDIHAAFSIASATSIVLVVSYLRLVCGLRRALTYAGGAQLVFLVLFSYAFFFEGYTGLTITLGAVVTLFVLMQLTGKVDWERALGRTALTPRAPTS